MDQRDPHTQTSPNKLFEVQYSHITPNIPWKITSLYHMVIDQRDPYERNIRETKFFY